MDCYSDCIGDAGPAPAANPAALPVLPSALEVTIQVTPATPTTAVDDGYFTLTVNVRNPATKPVVAKLGSTNVLTRSFQYDVRGAVGGLASSELVLDASSITFGPGETKRQVFDFSIGSVLPSRQLPPGVYTMMGAYGAHWSGTASVAVGP